MDPSESDLATVADDLAIPAQAGSRGRPLARGDTLGRYVVLERLGVGGMGEVFAAYDPELDRKIAVKLLLPNLGSVDASAGPSRLLREAQAMAKLRHRNVVGVHDVGTHEGRVFVAMEFVEGGTLADWIRAGSDGQGSPHPWRAVIERFVEAGRGLAAAHAAGLVHRDFKPANVLLGNAGQVQVADFGLVRRVSDDAIDDHEPTSAPTNPVADTLAVDETLAIDDTLALDRPTPSLSQSSRTHDSLSLRMTQTGATIGTPAYMAPEQYRGGTIDARADQFSFCVALWEALYGQRPFAGENLHALMFGVGQAAIREPPSGRDVPAPIRRAITRGLANAPEQRWPDMDGLLVALRWDPAQRRRRLRLLGFGLVLVGSVALGLEQIPEVPPPKPPPPACVGASLAFAGALAPARRDAIAERFGGFEHMWARDVGDRVLGRLDAWEREWLATWTDACEATSVRGEQSEELLDRRMLCLDRARNDFVELVDALANADEALARRANTALDELGTVARCSDVEALLRITPLPADRAEAHQVLRAEAAIRTATGLYLAGRYADARAQLETQRAVVDRIDYAPLAASFEHLDGRLAIYLDDRAGGEQALERGFARALAAGDDALAVDIARSLALAINENDRAKDALRWLDIAAALVERDGNDDVQLGLLAIARSQALANSGDYPAAEAAARDAYERLQRTRPDSAKVGDALYLLGTAAYRAGRFDEAIERVEEARVVWAREIGPRHPRNAAALTLLGVAARTQSKYADSLRYFEESLAIQVGNLGPDHVELTSAMTNLAVALADAGKLTEAIVLTERALAIRRAQPDPGPSEIGRTLVNLAELQRNVGRLAAAKASIVEGEALMREALGDDHPDLATVVHIRAQIELSRGELVEADRAAREAVRIAEAKLDRNHLGLRILAMTVAEVALARGQPREAIKWLDRSTSSEPAPEEDALHDFLRARALAELGQLGEARTLAKAAKIGFEAIGTKTSGRLAEVDRWLAAHPDPP